MMTPRYLKKGPWLLSVRQQFQSTVGSSSSGGGAGSGCEPLAGRQAAPHLLKARHDVAQRARSARLPVTARRRRRRRRAQLATAATAARLRSTAGSVELGAGRDFWTL